MPDSRQTAAPPLVIRREEYRPPAWQVPEILLHFDLDAERTQVRSQMRVERTHGRAEPLRLAAEGLELLWVKIDGRPADHRWEGDILVLEPGADQALVETLVEISPKANSQLMGLYESGGLLCTQCEAEGFRRITPFPDRPDVLSRYRVRMSADQSLYPILLSNGDPVASGQSEDGRHWAEWFDPFPKPGYLFALVAGNLAANRDRFTTMSGREVELAIWVREEDLPRTGHAMAALKASMKWDEEVYGREYDLAVFNIVAVSDFNFGAMENKGLNIFHSRYILADPETATDQDYDGIAAVVAHEYFHNWSGNRVTCRDWFQLSLKEGFTVFRDQGFSADLGSAAVKRIEDVRVLRAGQFPEDGGPLAHPVRPDSYLEISNFYTATVYNKGAELIRMIQTLLGPDAFRAACDLYFERFDGQAVTCEDFVGAMEESSGADLSQFRLWYSQAGTPRIGVEVDEAAKRLRLSQLVPPTPGQPVKKPMLIPLKIAFLDEASGRMSAEELVVLDANTMDLPLPSGAGRQIPSLNRGFSAPVIIESDRDARSLALLSAHDDDPFARYEAMQQLMLACLLDGMSGGGGDVAAVVDAVRLTLSDPELDPAFIAEAVLLPSEAFIGDHVGEVEPDDIHNVRERIRAALGAELEPLWRDAYQRLAANRYEYSPAAKGARRLRNVALGYIAAAQTRDADEIAKRQYDHADNMTDRQAALAILVNGHSAAREVALEDFYRRYRGDPLVLDKWFAAQALSTRGDTPAAVEALARHSDFTLASPTRLRALVGTFAGNQRAFHDRSGRGYRFLADTIIAADRLNPQTAARLVPPLGRWRRFDPDRSRLMRAELERLLAEPTLSKDVFEQVSKSLA